jgi:hypothetical protein
MIYILDNDPKKCAEALDDKSLDSMIRDIAQVLCNVHHGTYPQLTNIPLKPTRDKIHQAIKLTGWGSWARECRANYLWLVELGDSLAVEYQYRFNKRSNKYMKTFHWARDNVPDLPLSGCQCYEKECPLDLYQISSAPLVMPKKYQRNSLVDSDGDIIPDITKCYRNFYLTKLGQRMCQQCMADGVGIDYSCDQKFNWTNREIPERINLCA